MWEKRKEESSLSGSTDRFPERGVASNPATGNSGAVPPAGAATIGKAVRIKGRIHSREDLFVDGDVEGELEVLDHRLTVGPNGNARAAVIRAREVVVLGAIEGDVEAKDKIVIRRDAKLIGNIRTAGIAIDEGAYFKGSVDIVRPESKAAPAERPLTLSATG